MLKMTISTSVWSAQHPIAGRNIQHTTTKTHIRPILEKKIQDFLMACLSIKLECLTQSTWQPRMLIKKSCLKLSEISTFFPNFRNNKQWSHRRKCQFLVVNDYQVLILALHLTWWMWKMSTMGEEKLPQETRCSGPVID